MPISRSVHNLFLKKSKLLGFFSKKKNLLPNSIEKKIIYQKDGKDISNKTMLFSTRSVGLFEEKLDCSGHTY
jgi:hypothetical protein